jgi:hypothetical protein
VNAAHLAKAYREALAFHAVYAIGPPIGRPVKIVHANDIAARVARVARVRPGHRTSITTHGAYWFHSEAAAVAIEAAVHKVLAACAMRGGWFDIEAQQAMGAIFELGRASGAAMLTEPQVAAQAAKATAAVIAKTHGHSDRLPGWGERYRVYRLERRHAAGPISWQRWRDQRIRELVAETACMVRDRIERRQSIRGGHAAVLIALDESVREVVASNRTEKIIGL